MQPFRNVPQVVKNVGSSIVNKPGFFRDQSLILASLALVVSRIVVANVSAIKAQGTPEGPYRYRESIRTDMREVGGFTFGFLVLRLFQSGIRAGLRKSLGVTEKKLDDVYSLKQMWRDLRGDKKPAAFNPKLAYSDGPQLAGELSPWAQKLSDWFDKPVLKSLKNKVTEGVKVDHLPEAGKKALEKNKVFIKGIYKAAPILIGSIPTIALAGYFLERVTRDHSEQFVDAVSKRLGSTSNKGMKPLNVSSAAQVPTQPALPATGGSPQFGMRPMVSPYQVSPNLFATQRI